MPRGTHLPPSRRAEIAAAIGAYDTDARVARQFGITDSTVRRIANEFGIKRTRAGAVIRINATPPLSTHLISDDLDEAERSGKDRVLALIVNSGPFTDEAALSRSMVAAGIPLGRHETTHLLYSLKRQGRITFREFPGGRPGGQRLRIEATTAGAAGAARPEEPARTNGAEPPRQNEKPVPPEPVAEAPAPVVEASDKQPVSAGQYPLIRRLVQRGSLLRQAADALEKAGQDDLALATLAKVDDLSPLEREVLAFVEGREWDD